MIFTNSITLILALAPATLFAAPTKTVASIADVIAKRRLSDAIIKTLQDGNCDLSGVTLPIAPTPLPAIGQGLHLAHVAVGQGTQNYTCKTTSSSEIPVQVGAMATLYNVTCQTVRAPAVLADITNLALTHTIPKSDIAVQLTSGHHEFTDKGVPLFNLNTDLYKYGYVQAKKNGTSDAPSNASKGPNGLGSVGWLKLTSVEGDYKEVYRVNTAGGVSPKTCDGVNGHVEVGYSALYYFYK